MNFERAHNRWLDPPHRGRGEHSGAGAGEGERHEAQGATNIRAGLRAGEVRRAGEVVVMDKKSYEELESENKSLRHVISTWRKTTAQEIIDELEDKNKKLRVELHTLRFKESQEQRFIRWITDVYAEHVKVLLSELEKTTFPITPFGSSQMVKFLKEGTEHIYDGTYLDVS